MSNGKNMRIIDWIMKVPTVELKPLIEKAMHLKRMTLVLILVLVAVPGIFLSLGFVHLVGTQKIYCLNCHVNQRDRNFWRKSTVHADINCATCHDVKEGGMIGAAFHFTFSAKDDVVADRCVGCHKDDLGKPVGIDSANAKGRPANELIRIPHEKHIKELGIKCTYCHYNVFHERRPEKFATFRPTMDTCYTCHDEEKTACDTCHPKGLPSGASMAGKVGGGKMSYFPKNSGEVVFNHKKHVAKGLGCEACHDQLFKMRKTSGLMTMARLFEGKDCGHCHNGKGAFASTDCGRCHIGGVKDGGTIAYGGGGTGPVVFSHANHIGMGLKCAECHTKLFGYSKTSGKMTMDMMGKGKLCGGCHNGKKAFSSDTCDSCHKMS